MPSPAPDTPTPGAPAGAGKRTDAVYRLTVASPVGALTLFERGGAIVDLLWASRANLRGRHPTPLLSEARRQLAAYFEGRLRDFDLPLAPEGSAFQRRVWAGLRDIPFGSTETYGELAARIGSAPRAVGGACGANPIPILIPCHRVLGAGSTGGGGRTLHGYSGQGGVATKARLLSLEGVTVTR